MSLVWTLAPEATAATPKKKAVSKTQAKKSTPKKKAPAKTKTSVKKPIVKADPLNKPMVGTWFTLDAEGKFAKANKFVFTPAGEFNYYGPGWKSGGTFTLRDGNINLSWLQIDGQPVKPGTVKKTIPLADRKFQIERFVYGWAL